MKRRKNEEKMANKDEKRKILKGTQHVSFHFL